MTVPRTISPPGRPSFKLFVNTEEVPRSVNVLLIEILSQFNRIATARIVIADGDAAAQTFAQSSGELFVPGKEMDVQLGYNDATETVFKGVVVKQKIESRGSTSVLEITCKHKAHRLAGSEKFAVFQDVTDADVIQQKCSDYNVNIEAASTNISHENLVQYKCTNWDFVVNRAEANGQVVVCTEQDGLKTIAPEVAATADLDLQFGATILGFEAELDGRQQEPYLRAQGWNYANQEVFEHEAEQGDLATIGNLSPTDLSESLFNFWEKSFYSAIHTQQELQAVAEAEHKRRRLSKVRASVAIVGSAICKPGITVSLNGLGDRFSGNALVSGVQHVFKEGVWKTNVQIGTDPKSQLEKFKPEPKSNFALPRARGLEIGVVQELDDTSGEFRVRVYFPVLGDETAIWARVAQPDAGNNRTVFFRPEIGDEVIVGFLNDDPRAPIILGALHSSAKPSPVAQNADNHVKGIVTRSGLKLLFDDEKSNIEIETPSGNKLKFTDDEDGIFIEDQHGSTLEMKEEGIFMHSVANIEIKADQDISIEGMNVEIKAGSQLKAEGGTSAEFASGATTTIRGSIVRIN